MLDRLMTIRNAGKDVLSLDFNEEDSVRRRLTVNMNRPTLTVLFPPWHGGGWFYERLINRLAKNGEAVVAYYMDDQILMPDAEQVIRNFTYMRDTISDQLTNITADREYEKVRLIAMSLGNPLMSMVTTRFQGFDSATFITSSHSMAQSTWYGNRTERVRAGIEAEGYDADMLEQLWSEMSPINNLGALAGKQVELIRSSSDRIIPAEHQQTFAEAVVAAGIDHTDEVTRLGHYATIGRYCQFGQI